MWLICSLFGFVCAPDQAPGQEAFQNRQEQARALPPIVGRAVVVDGDTIEIGGKTITLQGIDAPESSQPCERADGAVWRCAKAAALG